MRSIWNRYLIRRDVRRSLRRLDRFFTAAFAERGDPRDVVIRTEHCKPLVRVRLRTRLRYRWERWRTKRKFGQQFLDDRDEIGRMTERAFLFGKEDRG